MPSRAVPLVAEECYHVYNRGHNREPIFFREDNWAHFIRLMRTHLLGEGGRGDQVVRVLAYCLMPNHFHLMIRPCNGAASEALRRLQIAYTKAINRERDRVGSLFQGPFQAIHVDEEAYAHSLSRYIHRNPLEAGLVTSLEDWAWSSYRDYVGLRGGTLVEKGPLLPETTPAQYRVFVEAGPELRLSEELKIDDSA